MVAATTPASELVFVVPVRHQDSVKDWDRVVGELGNTARSIAAQTDPAWRAVVIANEGAKLPELPSGFEVRRVALPLPRLPDRAIDEEAFYEAVRLDKGRRILAGLQDAKPSEYIMVVDFDDWVSRHLASFVKQNRGKPGWYLSNGYVSDGTRLLIAHDNFSELCGTSHIVRRDLFRITDGEASDDVVRRNLGSHKFLRHDLASTPEALSALPFPGAVYKIDNTQSTSGISSIRAAFLPRWLLHRRPKEFVKNLSRLRFMTDRIRVEFTLP